MKTRENKIFLKIQGKPLIYYTLKSFEEYAKIDSIIVTINPKYRGRLRRVIAQNGIRKVKSIENAFDTRQESTYHVIETLKGMNLPKDSYVIIHNAVNPFVRHCELDACLRAAQENGASLLGFKATDTVKIVDNLQFINHTPSRSYVWIAQTPQIIRFDIAVKAFEHAYSEGFIATDDTSLVEAIHERVKFVECSRENFKITYPQDMELAKRVHFKRVKEKRVWYA
jgi:2-C-methyl-D-erythritol 4-phosphate cytidylyltransferase